MFHHRMETKKRALKVEPCFSAVIHTHCMLTGGTIETETNVSQIEVRERGEERGWETKMTTTSGNLGLPRGNVAVAVVVATEVKGESGVGEVGTMEETRE